MKNITLCFIIQKIPGNVNEKSYLHQRETGNQSADIIAVNIHSTVPVAPQGCNGALEGSIDEFVISQRLFCITPIAENQNQRNIGIDVFIVLCTAVAHKDCPEGPLSLHQVQHQLIDGVDLFAAALAPLQQIVVGVLGNISDIHVRTGNAGCGAAGSADILLLGGQSRPLMLQCRSIGEVAQRTSLRRFTGGILPFVAAGAAGQKTNAQQREKLLRFFNLIFSSYL